MRIAQVTPVYPPHTGGIGTVAQDYADALRERGEEVVVFHKDNAGLFQIGNAAFAPDLLWKLRTVDVIHLHYPFYGGAFFAALASFLFKKPLVVTYHMKTKADGLLGKVFWLHRLLVEPFILARAKTVFVSSVDYAEAIDFSHKRLEALPFWVDVDRFKPLEGSKNETTQFIFVGGLDPAHYFKGVDVLLDAAAWLNGDWKLVVVGGGSLKEGYEVEVRARGLQERITFAGRVPSDDLPGYFAQSDVHVLPSIDRSEAFGIVTLEAAASGVPSIVSDLPGVRTLVEEEKTGFVVEPNNAEALSAKMQWMIDHATEREAMGKSARERVVATYTKDKIVDRLLAAYREPS